MNYVRLIGRSATEADLRHGEDGLEASLVIEIVDGSGSEFFRVRCLGTAALKVRDEAEQGPLIGRYVGVTGSLGQARSAGGAKSVFVKVREIDFIET
jgi:hypothetical protein